MRFAGLRVVDDNHILVKRHPRPVLLIGQEEDLLRLLGEVILGAMQGVMECLSDLEEIVAAGDDVPARIHFQFAHERDQPVEDLGDTPADRGGVHHLYGLAAERTRQIAELFQLGTADDGLVILQSGGRRRGGRGGRDTGMPPALAQGPTRRGHVRHSGTRGLFAVPGNRLGRRHALRLRATFRHLSVHLLLC